MSIEETPKKRGRSSKAEIISSFHARMQSEGAPVPIHYPRNIAIVGCYPGSWEFAPFEDDEWEIWGFSRRHMNKLPRCDKWFELHNPTKLPQFERAVPGYQDWVKSHPDAVTWDEFPRKELIKEFGPYFFKGGQIAWMLAHAITLKPKKIGIYGVNAPELSAGLDAGYARQRHEIQYFISIAKYRGIEIVVPPNCDLLEPGKLYE